MRDPNWWSEHETSAWERCREALLRDWEQTKADLTGKSAGHDLNQELSDTLQQAVGNEVIPPPDVPNWAEADLDFSHAEPAYRYGVGAGQRAAEDQVWTEMIEIELKEEWIELTPKPWDQSKDFVRRGWEASRAKTQSGKVGWALLWLLGVPLPVLLVLYLIRGH